MEKGVRQGPSKRMERAGMERSPCIPSAGRTSQNTPFLEERTRARSLGVGVRVRVSRAAGKPSRETREAQRGPALVSCVNARCASTAASLTLSKNQATEKPSISTAQTRAKEPSGFPPKQILILKTIDRLVAILRGEHTPPRVGKHICRGQRLDKSLELATHSRGNDFF